jgi:hypothetical protein
LPLFVRTRTGKFGGAMTVGSITLTSAGARARHRYQPSILQLARRRRPFSAGPGGGIYTRGTNMLDNTIVAAKFGGFDIDGTVASSSSTSSASTRT